ncbi:MAG: RHS repeat protein, partial [Spirochaetaceae bacterium]
MNNPVGSAENAELIAFTEFDRQTAVAAVENSPRVGDPVIIATGTLVHRETDISVLASLPFSLEREYRSDRSDRGLFGAGWYSPIEAKMIRGVKPSAEAEVVERRAIVTRIETLLTTLRAEIGRIDAAIERTAIAIGAYRTAGQNLKRAADRAYAAAQAIASPTIAASFIAEATELSRAATASLAAANEMAADLGRWADARAELVRNVAGYSVEFERHKDELRVAENEAAWSATNSAAGPVLPIGLGRIVVLDACGVPRVFTVADSSVGPPSVEPGATYPVSGTVLKPADGTWGSLTITTGGAVLDDVGDGIVRDFGVDGQLMRTRDAHGRMVEVVRGTDGRPRELRDQTTRRIRIEIDDGRVVAAYGPESITVRYRYDESGRLSSVTKPTGLLTEYLYDEFRLIAIVKPGGARLVYTYDGESGKVVSTTDEAGATEHFAYDQESGQTTYVNPSGVVTKYVLDEANREIRRIHADGSAREFEYDRSGRVIRVRDENLAVTAFEYDRDGRLATVIDPDGVALRREYVGERVSAVIDSAGSRTEFEYDALGSPVRILHPDGATDSITYDALGRIAARTDPVGATVRYEYDRNGYLAARIGPDGGREAFSYDAIGRPTIWRDATGGISEYRWDPDGRIVSYRDPLGSETSYRYDNRRDLVGVTEPDGAVYSVEYDSRHLPIVRSGPLGVMSRYTYRADTRVQSIAHVDGPSFVFEYDARGRVTAVTETESGSREVYEYDPVGRIVAVRNAAGHITRYSYTPGGRLKRVVHPDGAVRAFVYDSAGRLIEQIDELGGRTRFRYDARGRIIEIVDQLGYARTFEYDRAARLVSERDATGNETRFEYDRAGRLSTTVCPSGAVTSYVYDAAGRIVTRVDPTELAHEYTYDLAGRVTEYRTPYGGTVLYEYDERGNLVAETLPNGTRRTISYDAAARPIGWADTRGARVEIEYDRAGNPTLYRGETGALWTYAYDASGRVTAVDDPFGGIAAYRYDPTGRLVELSHGPTSQKYEYDSRGRLLHTTDPGGSRRSLEYDAVGNVVAFVDSLGLRHNLELDVAGRIVAESTRSAGLTRYSYDPAGRVVSVVGSDGRELRYRYDVAGSVAAIHTDTGASTFTYDRAGRVVSTENDAARQAFAYVGDRVVEFRDDATGVRCSYEYSAAGGVTSRVVTGRDGSRSTTSYSYDGNGLLTSIVSGSGEAVSFEYDVAGREVFRRFSDGSFTKRVFGEAGLIVGLLHGSTIAGRDRVVDATFFAYDTSGRRTHEMDISGRITEYQFDAAGRLHAALYPADSSKAESDRLRHAELHAVLPVAGASTGWHAPAVAAVRALGETAARVLPDRRVVPVFQYPIWPETFGYDGEGNRVWSETPAGRTEYRYDQAGRLVAVGHEAFGYDARGRIRSRAGSRATTELVYDANDRVISVTEITDSITTTIAYGYDAFGRRVLRTETRSDAPEDEQTTRFVYEPFGFDLVLALTDRAVARDRVAGGVLSIEGSQPGSPRPESASGPRLASVTSARMPVFSPLIGVDQGADSGATEFLFHAGRPLLADGAAPERYFHDALGSVVFSTSGRVDTADQVRYEAFGTPLRTTDVAFNTRLRDTHGFSLGFSGRITDPVTGLVDLGFRDYDPSIGRFTTLDPARDGSNWYIYAYNDPVNFIDPLGLNAVRFNVFDGGGYDPGYDPFYLTTHREMQYQWPTHGTLTSVFGPR